MLLELVFIFMFCLVSVLLFVVNVGLLIVFCDNVMLFDELMMLL